MWEVLLRTARSAAPAGGQAGLGSSVGGLTVRLSTALAHTIGMQQCQSKEALAKLRKRVKISGAAARRSWHHRSHVLQRASALWIALTAQEKGFGGAGVARSRGLWLGVARAPCLRVLAVLLMCASLWLLATEFCGSLQLLPPALAQAACPLPPLEAARKVLLRDGYSPSLVFVHALTLASAAIAVASMIVRSPLLAASPLLRWRLTDGFSLLQHAAWVRCFPNLIHCPILAALRR